MCCRSLLLLLAVCCSAWVACFAVDCLAFAMDGEYVCPECDRADQGECMPCEACSKWIHYYCKRLPSYFLVMLTKSTRKYTCSLCVHVCFQAEIASLMSGTEKAISVHGAIVRGLPQSPQNEAVEILEVYNANGFNLTNQTLDTTLRTLSRVLVGRLRSQILRTLRKLSQ